MNQHSIYKHYCSIQEIFKPTKKINIYKIFLKLHYCSIQEIFKPTKKNLTFIKYFSNFKIE